MISPHLRQCVWEGDYSQLSLGPPEGDPEEALCYVLSQVPWSDLPLKEVTASGTRLPGALNSLLFFLETPLKCPYTLELTLQGTLWTHFLFGGVELFYNYRNFLQFEVLKRSLAHCQDLGLDYDPKLESLVGVEEYHRDLSSLLRECNAEGFLFRGCPKAGALKSVRSTMGNSEPLGTESLYALKQKVGSLLYLLRNLDDWVRIYKLRKEGFNLDAFCPKSLGGTFPKGDLEPLMINIFLSKTLTRPSFWSLKEI